MFLNLTESTFRWLHVFFGILWIGHLYFFNWVNANVTPALDNETKRKVLPELMPRALFWFRMGAAATWVTGILLLGMVFHMNKAVLFDAGRGWGMGAGIASLLPYVAPFVYDKLAAGPFRDGRSAFGAGLVAVAILLLTFEFVGGFGYRGVAIHLGTTFGTIMAFNVWFRIWPAQRVILQSVKNGEPPSADLTAVAALRSRHNTFLSVPLLFTMVSMHATWIAGGPVRVTASLLLVAAAGWALASHMYDRARAVKGF